MPLFGRRTSLVTLVEEYCGIMEQRSGGTKKSWRTDQNRLREAARLLDAEYVEAISRQAVARALDAKEAQDVSPKTVNAFREILCRFLNWALRERGVKFNDTGLQNPVAMIQRRKEPDHEIVFLTDEQAVRLLEGLVDPELRAMVSVILFAGLRRGEVVWLRTDDVDLINRLIRVRAKEIGEDRWQPKTGRGRNVPISDRLVAELALYRRPTDAAWYFPSPHGCRWDEDNWSKRLSRAVKRLGIDVGALVCRHTFGTTLAKRDVSLLKISKLMGNSPEIVRKHYAHVMPEELRDEVELAAPPASIRAPRPAAEPAPLPVPAPMLVPPPIPDPQATEKECPAELTPAETAEAFPAANEPRRIWRSSSNEAHVREATRFRTWCASGSVPRAGAIAPSGALTKQSHSVRASNCDSATRIARPKSSVRPRRPARPDMFSYSACLIGTRVQWPVRS
jgi:integrase